MDLRDAPGRHHHDWPLVGRGEELGRIHALLSAESAAPVVIEGREGIGKTRLAREAIENLRGEGFAIEWIIANTAGASIPFGAMSPLLPPPRAGSVIGAYEVDTLPTIRHAIASRANERGLILAVDDAHNLDDASAALVHQLALTTDVRVLVTIERTRPRPDAISALRTDAATARVDLRPLVTTEIARLLEAGLGAPVDVRASAELARLSGGNALHLRELVGAAQRESVLVFTDDRWMTVQPLLGAPAVDLVDKRLDELEPAVREVLALLAIGEPLNLQVLDALGVHAGLVEAERRDLVRTDLDGRRFAIRVAHPLYTERVRARLPASRVRQIYRRLSEGVAATGLRRSDDVLRSVTWRLDAGLPAPPDLLLVGARRAIDGFDLRRAERFAKAAVDSGGGDAALVALADARLRQGRFTQALAALDAIDESSVDAADAPPDAEDDGAREAAALIEAVTAASAAITAEAAELRAVVTFIGLGRRRDALERLATTEATLTDLNDKARLRACRARLLLADGRPSDAVDLLSSIDPASLGTDTQSSVLGTFGPALALVGRFDDATAVVRQAHGPALGLDDLQPAGISWAPFTMLLVHGGRGEIRTHDELAAAIVERGTALRHDGIRSAGLTALGWSHCQRGDLTRAIGLLRDATAFPPRVDVDATFIHACGGLAAAYSMAGDPVAARQALALAASVPRPPVRWFDHRLAMGHAFAAAADGAFGESRDVLADHLAVASMSGQRWAQLFLCATAIRVGAADLVAPMLQQLRTTIDGRFVQICADHALASVHRDGAGLDAASVELERLGLVLAAAEASGVAAAAHDERGSTREAVIARVRAARLLARCPGASRPDRRLRPADH